MRRTVILSAWLLAAGVCPPGAGRADVVGEQPDSIFYVDGLLADSLDTKVEKNAEPFRPELKRYPLVDVRRRPMYAPTARPFSFSVNMPPQGLALRHLRMADTYTRQMDWGRALYEVQQGLELEPNNLLLLRKGAAVAALARKFGVADEYFRRVLKSYPDNVPFLAGRSGVLIRLLRFSDAQAAVDRALQLDPRYLAARFNKVCLQIANGATPAAGEWNELNNDEVGQVANWLDADQQDYLAALSDQGFTMLCNTVLGEGTRERLRDIVNGLKKAGTALAAGQWGEAEVALQGVKQLGLRAMGPDMDIGHCRYEKGEREAALAVLQALAGRYPENTEILYNYAFVLLNAGQYQPAATLLDKAHKGLPANRQIAFALACAYAGQGQMDKVWPIVAKLAESKAGELDDWLAGEEPYLRAIRENPRYAELRAGAVVPAAPKPQGAVTN
ncbi:MAG: tetratricopeptide repeat protein [Verrucomicrobiota bacterium]